MDFDGTSSLVVAAISALTACFWLIFCIQWTRAFLRAFEAAASLPSSSTQTLMKPSVSFHIGAFAYQFVSMLFYGFEAANEVAQRRSLGLRVVYWLTYSLYISASNFVGMSFTLGYGTLYSELSWKDIAILLIAGTVDFLATFLGYLDNPSLNIAATTAVMTIFVVVLALGGRTLYFLQKRIAWSVRKGHTAYRLTLEPRRNRVVVVLALCCLLFVEMAVEKYEIQPRFGQEAVRVSLWGLYVATATVVNAWILNLMKPDPQLLDIPYFEVEEGQEFLQEYSLGIRRIP